MGRIDGTVIFKGKSLAGVQVEAVLLSDGSITASTHSKRNGDYSLLDVPAGEYQVRMFGRGVDSSIWYYQVVPGAGGGDTSLMFTTTGNRNNTEAFLTKQVALPHIISLNSSSHVDNRVRWNHSVPYNSIYVGDTATEDPNDFIVVTDTSNYVLLDSSGIPIHVTGPYNASTGTTELSEDADGFVTDSGGTEVWFGFTSEVPSGDYRIHFGYKDYLRLFPQKSFVSKANIAAAVDTTARSDISAIKTQVAGMKSATAVWNDSIPTGRRLLDITDLDGNIASGKVNSASLTVNAVERDNIAADPEILEKISFNILRASSLTELNISTLAALKKGTGGSAYDLFTAAGFVGAGRVGTSAFIAGAVDTAALGTGAVTETKLANEAVTSIKIAERAVTEACLDEDSVAGGKIQAGAVSASKIADAAISDLRMFTDGTSPVGFFKNTDDNLLILDSTYMESLVGQSVSYANPGQQLFVRKSSGQFLEFSTGVRISARVRPRSGAVDGGVALVNQSWVTNGPNNTGSVAIILRMENTTSYAVVGWVGNGSGVSETILYSSSSIPSGTDADGYLLLEISTFNPPGVNGPVADFYVNGTKVHTLSNSGTGAAGWSNWAQLYRGYFSLLVTYDGSIGSRIRDIRWTPKNNASSIAINLDEVANGINYGRVSTSALDSSDGGIKYVKLDSGSAIAVQSFYRMTSGVVAVGDAYSSLNLQTGYKLQHAGVDVTDANGDIATNRVKSASIENLAVSESKLANLAVSTAKLQSLSVTDTKLADLSVSTAKLQALAVTTAKIAAQAITPTELADGAVTATKLGTGSVIETKLGTGSVTETKLGTAAVTDTKLADLSVSTAKLQALAVTTAKIAAQAITPTELADGAVTSAKIAAQAVSESAIAIGAVTSTKLGPQAVIGTAIGDLAVSTSKLQNSCVTEPKIADGAISPQKLQFELNSVNLLDRRYSSFEAQPVLTNVSGTVLYDTGMAHDGTVSLKLANSGTCSLRKDGLDFPVRNIRGDVQYLVSLYCNSPTTAASLKVYLHDESGTVIASYTLRGESPSTGWERLFQVLTVPVSISGSNGYLTIASDIAETVNIDSVQIELAGENVVVPSEYRGGGDYQAVGNQELSDRYIIRKPSGADGTTLDGAVVLSDAYFSNGRPTKLRATSSDVAAADVLTQASGGVIKRDGADLSSLKLTSGASIVHGAVTILGADGKISSSVVPEAQVKRKIAAFTDQKQNAAPPTINIPTGQVVPVLYGTEGVRDEDKLVRVTGFMRLNGSGSCKVDVGITGDVAGGGFSIAPVSSNTISSIGTWQRVSADIDISSQPSATIYAYARGIHTGLSGNADIQQLYIEVLSA